MALADDDPEGEVRFLGDIDNTPDAIKRIIVLSSRHDGRRDAVC